MSAASSLQVRRATIEDLDEIALVLADAFSDYPWTRWTIDAREHRTRVEGLQRLALQHIGFPHGQVWVAHAAGAIEAAAIWTDSRRPARHAWTDSAAAQQRALEGDRHLASQAAHDVTRRLQPDIPHLDLGVVGTRAALQRLGLGTAVLAPGLAAADQERIHAYLETSSEANLGFYRRFDFDVIDEVRIDDGPTVWAMLRAPIADQRP